MPTTPPRYRHLARELLLLVMGLALVTVGTLAAARALPPLHSLMHQFPWDGIVDWHGARCFMQHESPYTPAVLKKIDLASFGHPPTTPFWFLPLATMDRDTMHVVVAILSVVWLLIELQLIVSELGAPLAWPLAWCIFGLALGQRWFRDGIELAQISQMIALGITLAWLLLRRRQEVAAGIALGLTCTMKLFPGLLVLLLLVTRRWRAVAAAGGAWLAVAIVMTARYGISSWPLFFASQPAVANQWMGSIFNVSLHGILQRAFHPSCLGVVPVNGMALKISTAIGLVLICLGVWLARRNENDGESLDLQFAWFTSLSLFLSQWTWEHYDPILLLPVGVALAGLVRRIRLPGSRWPVLLASLALTIVLWVLQVETHLKKDLSLSGRSPATHLRLHAYEAASVLPLILLLIVLGAWLWARRSHVAPPRTA